ncbi:GNAT family N-acetyltransferase [Paraflavitalea sp. CAU 1676]|uniref:GNAT family N-acetyltransferase n=1 Tax=Paraflavitalea sp. CAU 1676 TaxID=3032598 RepID=UPI0023DC06A4|nr:GNAT family N-acetyltransferase [Paraflavitalea sp. CAU 1676]MDF2190971.1 GNAT family N-acetyltransferase [Paraflavitalea sp. CAU 1676]
MITIEPMLASQAAILLDIYRQGILSGMATFETSVPEWPEFDDKYHPHSRIIARQGDEITGWAALSPVSNRSCYEGVAEVSVYVAHAHQRQGIGRVLLMELIRKSERNGIWSLLSVIHEENKASIHLHEQCGFRYIGYRERIAQLDGIWRTTVMLERRSDRVGL